MRRLRSISVWLVMAVLAVLTTSHGQTAPRIYCDKIDPHWFEGGDGQTNLFWYRLDLAGGRRKFVLVNAKAGTRVPAFDHSRAAGALSKLISRKLESDRLPIDAIQFSGDGKSVLLLGSDGAWNLNLQSYSLTVAHGAGSLEDLPVSLTPHPTESTGAETVIDFLNRLQRPVRLFWIDEDGQRRPYGIVQPGESRKQNTYAGHVWLVADFEGNVVAVCEAKAGTGRVVIDQRSKLSRDQPPDETSPRTISPNGRWGIVLRGDNLFLADLKSGEEKQLTYDGNPAGTYRSDAETGPEAGTDCGETAPEPEPEIYWSPDSRYVVGMKLQPGATRKVYEVQSSPPDQLQPRLISFPYLKPGDQVPIRKPHLFAVESGMEIPVNDRLFSNPWSITDVRWEPGSKRFTFVFNQRGHQVLRVLAVEARTGAVHSLVDEESKTFIDYSGKYFCDYLYRSHEIIWMSERDGWNHLYLYNSDTGSVKHQITKGDWVVRQVDYVDEARREIWFQAGGIVPCQNPYYVQECRVRFDGTDLTVLTHGNGTHSVQFSPDRRYLIDTWSRVDQPPIMDLRDAADGRLICHLERADAREWIAAARPAPESFVAKGRDGITDIYGVIWRPKGFKVSKRYPVIESIYAGPQDSFTPESFHASYPEQDLADHGFIVVRMDGMGTSNRSKKFQDVCWKNLKDAGFPDRILWIKAAAAKYPCMDLTRVGIYGTSAGGQDALRGMLDHGDFYKVGVADSGCYDNRMDKIWWNEQWMGWPVDESYLRSSCVVDADKLRGKLMLMVGELDHNVDPSSTMQEVNALVQANKDFDLVFMPNTGHGVAETPYGWKRLREFFIENLLQNSDDPPPPIATPISPGPMSPTFPAEGTNSASLSHMPSYRSPHLHDPGTMRKQGHSYFIFGDGDGISGFTSTDLEHWTRTPPVFPNGPPAWTTNAVHGGRPNYFWAPDLAYFDGLWHIYYAYSQWGKVNSAIGVATSPSLISPTWTDRGKVVESNDSPGANTDTTAYNCIDPSLCVAADGTVWMSFGSYSSGILVTQINPATGLRLDTNSLVAVPVANNAPGGGWGSSEEGSCIYQHGRYWYLFVNWGRCCAGVYSTYNIRVGRGASPTGPYYDQNGVNLNDGGGTMFLETTGRYIGPGHAAIMHDTTGIDWFTYHFYDGLAHGRPTVAIKQLSWSADGWPEITNDWRALYPLTSNADETSGTYDGVLENAAGFTNDPARGGALNLDGASGYVTLPLSVGNCRTVAAWVKWTGGPASQHLFDFGSGTNSYFFLTPMSAGGNLRCGITTNGPGGEQQINATFALPANSWHHVAVTLIGSTGILYVDGMPVATNRSLTIPPWQTLPHENYIGKSRFPADPLFHGEISSFQIFGRALSGPEIENIYLSDPARH